MPFECYNRPDHLKVVLYIGPGLEETRSEAIFDGAGKHTAFQNSIKKKDYEESQTEDLQVKIEKIWKEFVENDFPKIMEVLRYQQT